MTHAISVPPEMVLEDEVVVTTNVLVDEVHVDDEIVTRPQLLLEDGLATVGEETMEPPLVVQVGNTMVMVSPPVKVDESVNVTVNVVVDADGSALLMATLVAPAAMVPPMLIVPSFTNWVAAALPLP
jgi:hypothetical protein